MLIPSSRVCTVVGPRACERSVIAHMPLQWIFGSRAPGPLYPWIGKGTPWSRQVPLAPERARGRHPCLPPSPPACSGRQGPNPCGAGRLPKGTQKDGGRGSGSPLTRAFAGLKPHTLSRLLTCLCVSYKAIASWPLSSETGDR
jgi:hypothetical protein